MYVVYQILYIIFLLLYILAMPFKGKRREGIIMRLGFYPDDIKNKLSNKPNIWIHAVSVGEIMAARPLVDAINKHLTGYNIIISTVTETGNKTAKTIMPDDIALIYLPLDITFAIKRAIKAVKPVIFIIIETEIWPNILRNLNKNNVPVILSNGRISKRSYVRYLFIKPVLKNILGYINRFLMRTDKDASRIISLGAEKERVSVCGNVKFDSADFNINEEEKNKLRNLLQLENKKLIVSGSTHPGEEKIILQAYTKLKQQHNDLLLLIAPRHIERTEAVAKLIKSHGFTPVKISNLTPNSELRTPNCIFILDTIGQLKLFYSIAWIAFVGGSLIKHGGQNMIEPACFAKPILFGPHTFNFEDIANEFLNKRAAMLVNDASTLIYAVEMLYKDEALAKDMGMNAQMAVKANRGAVDKTIEAIKNSLSK